MHWKQNELDPVEKYVYRGELVIVGEFDCPVGHECFPVTESVQNNLFVLATRPLWFRRNTSGFQYIGPGGVLLHPSGCTIERRGDPAAHDFTYWFAIRDDVYREITETHGIDHDLPTESLCPGSEIQLELRLLIERVRDGSTRTVDVESSVLDLLDRICSIASGSGEYSRGKQVRPTTRARARRIVDAAKSLVDENLSDSMGIGEIASEIGVSPFHLCRLFKSVDGITLHEYRVRQRMGFVMQKLASCKQLNLTDVALDAGFSNHSHLTRTFRSRLGISPSGARRLLNA